jgi:hypothetical protein
MDWPAAAVLIAGILGITLYLRAKVLAESDVNIEQICADHELALARLALIDGNTVH